MVRVSQRRTGPRCSASARWGLVPPWADGRRGRRPHDQRAGRDGRHLRAFAPSFARRRCLVPADGWYEWVRAPSGGKQAVLHDPPRRLGARLRRHLVGLGVRRGGPCSPSACSPPRRSASWPRCTTGCRCCCRRRWADWLDAGRRAGAAARAAAGRATLAGLEIRPVGAAVGDVRNDGPELIARVPRRRRLHRRS